MKKKKKTPHTTRMPRVIEHAEPPIETPEDGMVIEDRQPELSRHFWPKNEPLPTHWVKPLRRQTPCPKCRRVLTDTLDQAARCQSSGDTLAWFKCIACGHRWCLPVRINGG